MARFVSIAAASLMFAAPEIAVAELADTGCSAAERAGAIYSVSGLSCSHWVAQFSTQNMQTAHQEAQVHRS